VPPYGVPERITRTEPQGTSGSQPKRRSRSGIQFLGSLVARKNEALIFRWILVPELCSLAVERARAVVLLVQSQSLVLSFLSPIVDLAGTTHLLGSPNRLCKLNSTVVIL
jgi:hypothetical protein